ncbi:MAG: ABC transporter ATP-binding protein [Lautropia sp.]
MSGSVLTASGVDMRFGGVVALRGAAVEVAQGQIVGLIGRNGSGKTTLFNCITGFIRPSGGSIRLDGREIGGMAPHQIVRAGVVRTFQTPRIEVRCSVREAVLCGLYPTVRHGFFASALCTPKARAEERRLQRDALEAIQRLGLDKWIDSEVGRLSMAGLRMVEVCRAVASRARFLLLDEPAAGLSADERAILAREIRKLASEGIGVLLVEHNFGLIRMLCDTVTVLDSGSVLVTGSPEAIARDEQVLELYLGSAAEAPMQQEVRD